MDLTTVFMPGAQSLVTAILTDTWTQARAAVAKLWVRRHPATTLDQAGHQLEAARTQALELAGTGPEPDRAARMQLFWAGYLAGQAAARPELAAAFAELPKLLAAAAPQQSQTTTTRNTNSMSGTFSGLTIQVGTINGGFNQHGK
jgi:hypothetical protein